MNSRILTSKTLSADGLATIFDDKALALIVSNFYCEKLSTGLAKSIVVDSEVEKYTHEKVEGDRVVHEYLGVDRLGTPFNSVYGKSRDDFSVEYYYNSISKFTEKLRKLAAPALTPIDKLRLELDERHLDGATVASFQGKKMFAGIARITRAAMSVGSETQPHFDALPHQYAEFSAQFAANIYLSTPTSGGELEIWDVPPMSPTSCVPLDWRGHLPESVKIAPKAGDLIIFNCRRPHAVCAFSTGVRVSLQAFIGYRPNEPLEIWN